MGTVTGLEDVTTALRIWGAEANAGAPVTDGQLLLLAGDVARLGAGLALNRRWRRALACGDRGEVEAVLADAEAFAGERQ